MEMNILIPSIGIFSYEKFCLLLMVGLMLLGYIFAFFFIRRRQPPELLDPEIVIRKKHNQLVKEERLIEAKALFLNNYSCFDSNRFRELLYRVGEAHLDISNKDNLDTLFALSIELCSSNKDTPLKQRETIQRKTQSILIARTRFLLRSYKSARRQQKVGTSRVIRQNQQTDDAARYEGFLELWKIWLDFLELYVDGSCSVFSNHFRILCTIQQVLTKPEILEGFKSAVDPLRLQQVQTAALQRCKALVVSQKWEEAFLQYNIFIGLHSQEKENCEYTLLIEILIQIALKNLEDSQVVMDTFEFVKCVVFNDYVTQSEKMQCVSMLSSLLEARIKFVLPSIESAVDFYEYLQNGIDQMEARFLVRLEVFHLWQEFLKIRQEANQCDLSTNHCSTSAPYYISTEFSKLEEDVCRAKSLIMIHPPVRINTLAM